MNRYLPVVLLVLPWFSIALAQEQAAEPSQTQAQEAASDSGFSSLEDELAPHPELGPRTLWDMSPEAREIRTRELIGRSRRPMPSYSPQAKQSMYDMMAASSPMSIRDMLNWMTWKVKAKEGVTFEDILETMDLKANELNFKKVGHNQLWLDVAANTGKPTTRVEVLSYCDAVIGRRMMDISPEFSAFIPCRITVYEDYNGDLWLMTMDWDVAWLRYVSHPDSRLNAQLIKDGIHIRNVMTEIMESAAAGEW